MKALRAPYAIVRPRTFWTWFTVLAVATFVVLMGAWFVARLLFGTAGSAGFLALSILFAFGFGKMMQRWQTRVIETAAAAEAALREGALPEAIVRYDELCTRTVVRPDTHTVAVTGRAFAALRSGDLELGEALLAEVLDAGWAERQPELLANVRQQLEAVRAGRAAPTDG